MSLSNNVKMKYQNIGNRGRVKANYEEEEWREKAVVQKPRV
jgi:hypothetical protein